MPTKPPDIFQYTTETVQAGDLTLDALALDCYIRRAWSAYGTGAVYSLGAAGGKAEVESFPGQEFDCTGFLWWCTYRSRKGTLWPPNKWWMDLGAQTGGRPIAGCMVRHDAPPGAKYGHAGIVVYVHPDGDYDTLDSSSTDPKARGGSIRYIQRAAAFWAKKPNMQFVVSTEAVTAVAGIPHKRDLNLLLAAAKRPVQTSIVAVVALVALGGLAYWGWSRGARLAQRNRQVLDRQSQPALTSPTANSV